MKAVQTRLRSLIASASASVLPRALWWVLSRFTVIMLITILVLWDIFLSKITIIDFSRNFQDFGRFYYATLAYLDGQEMYGPTQGTLIQLTPLYAQHIWDLNPPHFHILIYPLTYLSFSNALVTWLGLSIIAFLASGYLIFKEMKLAVSFNYWCIAICIFLGFSGTSHVLLTAQVSFLLLLPLTLAWTHARHDRWTTAGIYLGILAGTKLFLLLFLPYLFFRRQFRAFTAMVISFLSCFGIGIVMFGWETYLDWIYTLKKINWAWGHTNASLMGFLSRTFSETPVYVPWEIGTNINWLWVLIASVLGIITILVAIVDTTPNCIDRAFSVLVLGALLISPLGWLYYMFLMMGPILALIYSWRNEWFPANNLLHPTLFHFRTSLILLGMLGLLLPIHLGSFLQPSPLATVGLASVYFWALLAIWSSLVLDGVISQKTFPQESSSVDPQNQKMDLQHGRDTQMANENIM